MHYKTAIEQFRPTCEQEENDKKLILAYMDQVGDAILTRQSELAHITSSGFIMNRDRTRVLLAHHNIYDKWAWTGGHADGDADLLAVAVKEAREETGVQDFSPLSRDIVALDILPVWGHVKRGKYVSGHLHLSIAYLLTCDENAPLVACEGENSAVQWFGTDYFTPEHFVEGDVALYGKLIAAAQQLL